MAFLTQQQLGEIGFRYLGKNIKISDKASIYNPGNIHLDDNCRIDDFCIISAGLGGIFIGKHVHIAAYSSLIGTEQIYLADFCGLSSKVSIYSSSDDYSGEFMTNPTVHMELRSVDNHPVFLDKHVIIGAGTVILPGAKLNQGVAIGALSLVLGKDYPEFMIYAGVPARPVKQRKRNILELENKMLNSGKNNA